ncbi:MAG TPA: carboxypeptidase regulatory-like domain-containing protein [Candidatus Sulfobium mesophilum]|nr:carboxypeptidase regulatory-like domain-containing protein [Candidatus Sulfobium mesophilum]
MKRKHSLLLSLAVALCMLFARGAYAANGIISGIVKDIATGAAVSGATVSSGSASTTTSSTGAYNLSVPAGSYTLQVSSSGYLTTNQVASVAPGASTTVNWALTKTYGNQAIPAKNMNYMIFAWNDLGMHCDQDDYSYFMVLPPYNTLHAQVFQRSGDGANLITSGITISYAFPKKTNSALHTNFWAYAPQYGFNAPTNVGISGTPLAGNMSLDAKGLSWEAVGIPITPYDDDGTWDPYGTAVITVKNSSGQVLQTANVVAPVSTEMMCSNCHGTTNPQLDILQKHDALSGTTLAADQAKGTVHACAECHADNALGMPGKAGVENLSLAMHNFHKDKMNTTPQAMATTPGCYNCHPGPKTQCLRGIMFRAGKTCSDCHGDMYGMTNGILAGRQPWLEEPQCGGCHGATYSENANTLFRNSVLQNSPTGDMDNRIYCEACHNGTHAEYTTANTADPTIPMQLQGDNYWIWNCNVCHSATQRSMHRAVSNTTTTYTITASAGTGGSISPSGSVNVSSGGNQTFTITPASGYAISGVLVDGTSVGAVSSYTFSTVTANHTISASFKTSTTTTYTITASAGTGGSISPSGSVAVSSGTSKTFTITPAERYHIYRVLVDGSSVGAVTSYTFSNVTRNHTISASFTRRK